MVSLVDIARRPGLDLECRHLLDDLLQRKGMVIQQVMSIDVALIAASSSTKNKEWVRDLEMCQTKMDSQLKFGLRVDFGVGKNIVEIRSVVTITVNEHDHGLLNESHGLIGRTC